MLMGLLPPKKVEGLSAVEKTIELKMSKSIPDSAIFMADSPQEVKRKIEKAYCPAKTVYENPLVEYMKYIIFEKFQKVKIERPAKFGGDLEIESYSEFVRLYEEGKIHPTDLKQAVANYINEILEPVRKHFQNNSRARELEEFVRKQEITR
jgi:tyrosyl-tRNA synthetase